MRHFLKKSGPLPEKCGRFTRDFLKNVDLNVQFSEKKWTLTRRVLLKVDLNLKNMDLYACFSKQGDLDLRNIVLYT